MTRDQSSPATVHPEPKARPVSVTAWPSTQRGSAGIASSFGSTRTMTRLLSLPVALAGRIRTGCVPPSASSGTVNWACVALETEDVAPGCTAPSKKTRSVPGMKFCPMMWTVSPGSASIGETCRM